MGIYLIGMRNSKSHNDPKIIGVRAANIPIPIWSKVIFSLHGIVILKFPVKADIPAAVAPETIAKFAI